MSYILDALKKSETERQRQQATGNASHARARAQLPVPARRRRGWLWLALLLAGVAVLWALFRPLANAPVAPVTASEPISAASDRAVTHSPQRGQHPSNASASPAQPMSAAAPQSLPGAYQELPFMWELPEPDARQLAALHVTIHVYARAHEQQILFINDRKYRQGERTPEGARIEAIVEQGVIMSYRGQYFKLSRPR